MCGRESMTACGGAKCHINFFLVIKTSVVSQKET